MSGRPGAEDPRNKAHDSIPGQGGHKTYRGTGQDRQSQQRFTSAQSQAIRNLLEREGKAYNATKYGQGTMPGYYQPEDLDKQAKEIAPAWVRDPWRMDQGWKNAGGRGPAGLGNHESEHGTTRMEHTIRKEQKRSGNRAV